MKQTSALASLLLCAAPLAANDWSPLMPKPVQFQSSVAHVEWTRPPKPKMIDSAAKARTSPSEIEKEATAIALRLGLSSDSTFEADPAAVREFVGILTDLRSRYPEVAALSVGAPMGTSVLVRLDAESAHAVGVANWPAPAPRIVPDDAQGGTPDASGAAEPWSRRVQPSTLGVAPLDAAVSALGGRYDVTIFRKRDDNGSSGPGDVMVVVEFGRALDLRKAAAALKVPGVLGVSGNLMIVGGAGMSGVERAQNGAWKITLTNGWGDCMAGCIYREKWVFEARGGQTVWKGYTGYGFDTVNKKMVPVEAEPPSSPQP